MAGITYEKKKNTNKAYFNRDTKIHGRVVSDLVKRNPLRLVSSVGSMTKRCDITLNVLRGDFLGMTPLCRIQVCVKG